MHPLGWLLPFVLCVAAAAPPSSSQLRLERRTPAGVYETDHLTVRMSTGRPSAAPGARIPLFVDITPKPKMHVYAPGQTVYIPVSVALARDPLITTHPPVFPRAEPYVFKPLNETLRVYTRPFRIVQDVTIANVAALSRRATLTVTGTLRYQACDEEICYLPQSLPVTWTVPLLRK